MPQTDRAEPTSQNNATVCENTKMPGSAVRSALIRMHAATVLFGISGIFGKLCQCSAIDLVCGRALVAVAALGGICLIQRNAPWKNVKLHDLAGLGISGVLLTLHFVTFFGSSSFDVEFMKPLRPESGPQSGRPW